MGHSTHEEVEKNVIAAIASTLNVSQSKLTLSIGVGDIPDWDSLGHVNVISGVEEAFDVIFDVEEALDCETVQDIVEIVVEKIEATA